MLRAGNIFFSPLCDSDCLSIKYFVAVEKIKYNKACKANSTVPSSRQSHRKILI